MSVKNHQTEPTIRPDRDLGDISTPCCMKAPNANQNELMMLNSLTVVWVVDVVVGVEIWPCGSFETFMRRHSYGENLDTMYNTMLTLK